MMRIWPWSKIRKLERELQVKSDQVQALEKALHEADPLYAYRKLGELRIATPRSNCRITGIQAATKHSKPWLANFVASMRNCDRQTELYGIIALARNMLLLCEAEKITGNAFNERLCRAVLYRIRRFADFSLLQESDRGDLKVVKDAQRRLEGMVGRSI